jgi:LysE type translocator
VPPLAFRDREERCFPPARADGKLRSGSPPEDEAPSVSIEFLLTSLIVVASPGTGVLVTLAAGLSRGARAAVVAALGCTLGIVPHMLAAVTGLAALLHTSALASRSSSTRAWPTFST